jgi:hypothetical protein
MTPPRRFSSRRRHYQLRGVDAEDRLLVVIGNWFIPGSNLESGLRPVEGERFETWSRPMDQPPHVVVRIPPLDVHVSGSVPVDIAMNVARDLVEVTPSR